MDLGIEGRVALVTGADSGIGWHTARQLLAEGATVVITDLDEDKLSKAQADLNAPSGKLFAFPADVTSPDSVENLAARTAAAVGDIDILVQSAGIHGAGGLFHEIDDEGRARTIETDLLGQVRVTRAFLPGLRRGGWGRIVFLASEDGQQPYIDELPYCASKAGVLALAKGLSKTYGSEGILVNAVSPAFIHTPMTDEMMNKRADEMGTNRDEAIATFLDEQRPGIEVKRRGEPDEVASVIVFLCSERASFVNGSNYRVDAGSVATI